MRFLRGFDKQPESNTRLIVGLGNPGEKYAKTRHNAGFWVLDAIVRQTGGTPTVSRQMQAQVLRLDRPEGKLILAWPLTYMNESGQSIEKLMRKHGLSMQQLMVIYDDIDLPAGRMRIRHEGGPGTHNGMASVVAHVGGKNFARIRIGVDACPPGVDLKDYVLKKPAPVPYKRMMATAEAAAQAALLWADGQPLDRVMNRYNPFDATGEN